jgi:hypothetical protein
MKTRKNTFTLNDYNSKDGMLTNVWGPALWHVLHIMSFNYPIEPCEEDKQQYMNFIINLQYILPCKYCRINLKKNLLELPLTTEHMKNRESFSKYVYDLHELINTMLNKKSGLTYEMVRERYEHFRARCQPPKIIKAPIMNKTKTKKNKEKGCTEPLYGKKSRCIIKIVPHNDKGKTLQIDKKCIKKRISKSTSQTRKN